MRLIYADDRVHGPSENWQFACKFRATSRRTADAVARGFRSTAAPHRIGEIPRILRSGGEVAPVDDVCIYTARVNLPLAREETKPLESEFPDISVSVLDICDIAIYADIL